MSNKPRKTIDIDYALVEGKRPPIYTALKYWGKKPHNIWRRYIETYTDPKGVYLDPFSGSAISAFEAFKAGKKAIAFDLNPLTEFIIEVLPSINCGACGYPGCGQYAEALVEADADQKLCKPGGADVIKQIGEILK